MTNLIAQNDYSLSDQEIDTQRFSTANDDEVTII